MLNKQKILIVADFALSEKEMLDKFRYLEQHNVELISITDRPNDTNEQFQTRMLKMETEGPEPIEPAEGLIDKIKDADVLIVHFSVVTKSVIEAAAKLKLIAVLRGGWENVNMEAARAKGITVVNSPGRSGDAVADFTVGLMIAESKNIVRSSLNLYKGTWAKRFHNTPYLHNLRNQTVGIIGLGEIGQRVAKRLKGFDTKLIAYDPYLKREEIIKKGCSPVDLDELLRTSDFVTLHMRFTEATKHLIGKTELSKMKPTAYLINTARAGLIDENALIEALANRTIGGAAIDVFSVEPLPENSPFLKLENITITPHLAGTSSDTLNNSFEILGTEIVRFLKNEKLLFVKS